MTIRICRKCKKEYNVPENTPSVRLCSKTCRIKYAKKLSKSYVRISGNCSNNQCLEPAVRYISCKRLCARCLRYRMMEIKRGES